MWNLFIVNEKSITEVKPDDLRLNNIPKGSLCNFHLTKNPTNKDLTQNLCDILKILTDLQGNIIIHELRIHNQSGEKILEKEQEVLLDWIRAVNPNCSSFSFNCRGALTQKGINLALDCIREVKCGKVTLGISGVKTTDEVINKILTFIDDTKRINSLDLCLGTIDKTQLDRLVRRVIKDSNPVKLSISLDSDDHVLSLLYTYNRKDDDLSMKHWSNKFELHSHSNTADADIPVFAVLLSHPQLFLTATTTRLGNSRSPNGSLVGFGPDGPRFRNSQVCETPTFRKKEVIICGAFDLDELNLLQKACFAVFIYSELTVADYELLYKDDQSLLSPLFSERYTLPGLIPVGLLTYPGIYGPERTTFIPGMLERIRGQNLTKEMFPNHFILNRKMGFSFPEDFYTESTKFSQSIPTATSIELTATDYILPTGSIAPHRVISHIYNKLTVRGSSDTSLNIPTEPQLNQLTAISNSSPDNLPQTWSGFQPKPRVLTLIPTFRLPEGGIARPRLPLSNLNFEEASYFVIEPFYFVKTLSDQKTTFNVSYLGPGVTTKQSYSDKTPPLFPRCDKLEPLIPLIEQLCEQDSELRKAIAALKTDNPEPLAIYLYNFSGIQINSEEAREHKKAIRNKASGLSQADQKALYWLLARQGSCAHRTLLMQRLCQELQKPCFYLGNDIHAFAYFKNSWIDLGGAPVSLSITTPTPSIEHEIATEPEEESQEPKGPARIMLETFLAGQKTLVQTAELLKRSPTITQISTQQEIPSLVHELTTNGAVKRPVLVITDWFMLLEITGLESSLKKWIHGALNYRGVLVIIWDNFSPAQQVEIKSVFEGKLNGVTIPSSIYVVGVTTEARLPEPVESRNKGPARRWQKGQSISQPITKSLKTETFDFQGQENMPDIMDWALIDRAPGYEQKIGPRFIHALQQGCNIEFKNLPDKERHHEAHQAAIWLTERIKIARLMGHLLIGDSLIGGVSPIGQVSVAKEARAPADRKTKVYPMTAQPTGECLVLDERLKLVSHYCKVGPKEPLVTHDLLAELEARGTILVIAPLTRQAWSYLLGEVDKHAGKQLKVLACPGIDIPACYKGAAEEPVKFALLSEEEIRAAEATAAAVAAAASARSQKKTKAPTRYVLTHNLTALKQINHAEDGLYQRIKTRIELDLEDELIPIYITGEIHPELWAELLYWHMKGSEIILDEVTMNGSDVKLNAPSTWVPKPAIKIQTTIKQKAKADITEEWFQSQSFILRCPQLLSEKAVWQSNFGSTATDDIFEFLKDLTKKTLIIALGDFPPELAPYLAADRKKANVIYRGVRYAVPFGKRVILLEHPGPERKLSLGKELTAIEYQDANSLFSGHDPLSIILDTCKLTPSQPSVHSALMMFALSRDLSTIWCNPLLQDCLSSLRIKSAIQAYLSRDIRLSEALYDELSAGCDLKGRKELKHALGLAPDFELSAGYDLKGRKELKHALGLAPDFEPKEKRVFEVGFDVGGAPGLGKPVYKILSERLCVLLKKIELTMQPNYPKKVILLEGLPGTGKSTLLEAMAYRHVKKGQSVFVLDTWDIDVIESARQLGDIVVFNELNLHPEARNFLKKTATANDTDPGFLFLCSQNSEDSSGTLSFDQAILNYATYVHMPSYNETELVKYIEFFYPKIKSRAAIAKAFMACPQRYDFRVFSAFIKDMAADAAASRALVSIAGRFLRNVYDPKPCVAQPGSLTSILDSLGTT